MNAHVLYQHLSEISVGFNYAMCLSDDSLCCTDLQSGGKMVSLSGVWNAFVLLSSILILLFSEFSLVT